MAKQELSLKQQYQRLTQAKAQATRNGQPTPKPTSTEEHSLSFRIPNQ